MPAYIARDFGGMQLGRSPRLIPPNAARDAANVDLSSGALMPMVQPRPIHTLGDPAAKRAAHLRFNDGTTFWLPLSHRLSDVVQSPVVNDSHERVYVLDPPRSPLRFNTKARLLNGDPFYLLGLPAPVSAPTVTVTGGSGPNETRAYVYTFVDAFGHEGPPSEPTVQSGPGDGSWQVSAMDTSVPDASQRPTVRKRIYRTLPVTDGTGGYFFVAEVDLADASYTDTVPGTLVALNNPLESLSFYAPPDDLDGMVLMPGGFIIGWSGRDLRFSVPYRPWAWPPEFDLTLEHQVVGIGVSGQTAVCATAGAPYALTGTSPAQVTPSKFDTIEPCLDKGTVMSDADGVYYASRRGLVFVTAASVRVITQDIIPEADWCAALAGWGTGMLGAAKTRTQLLVLADSGRGFRVDVRNNRLAVSRLQNFTRYSALWNDAVTGGVLLLDTFGSGNPVVYELPVCGSNPAPYLWSSGEITTPRPVNLVCGRVELDAGELMGRFAPRRQPVFGGNLFPSFAPVGVWPDGEDQHVWRTSGASVVGYCVPGTFRPAGTLPAGTVAPGTESFGSFYAWPFWPGMVTPDSRLYLASVSLPENVPCWLWYWAGRRLVFAEPILDDSMFRLPSGFKSDTHAFAVVSRYPIHSVQFATSPNELEIV